MGARMGWVRRKGQVAGLFGMGGDGSAAGEWRWEAPPPERSEGVSCPRG